MSIFHTDTQHLSIYSLETRKHTHTHHHITLMQFRKKLPIGEDQQPHAARGASSSVSAASGALSPLALAAVHDKRYRSRRNMYVVSVLALLLAATLVSTTVVYSNSSYYRVAGKRNPPLPPRDGIELNGAGFQSPRRIWNALEFAQGDAGVGRLGEKKTSQPVDLQQVHIGRHFHGALGGNPLLGGHPAHLFEPAADRTERRSAEVVESQALPSRNSHDGALVLQSNESQTVATPSTISSSSKPLTLSSPTWQAPDKHRSVKPAEFVSANISQNGSVVLRNSTSAIVDRWASLRDAHRHYAAQHAGRVRGRVVPQSLPRDPSGAVANFHHRRLRYETISEGFISITPSTRNSSGLPNATLPKDEWFSSTSNGLLSGSAIDSTVWLSFVVPLSAVKAGSLNTNGSVITANDVLRAGKRMLVRAMGSHPDNTSSVYHQFFSKYSASLWVVDNRTSNGSNIANPEEQPDDFFFSCNDTSRQTFLEPLQFDVVYTYVNNSSPSHLNFTSSSNNYLHDSDPARFRDWNELLYSMRGVYQYGICRAGAGHIWPDNRSVSCSDELNGVVRNVYIVVAHKDQAPTWLLQDHPRVRIVTHHEMFPPEDHQYLPTFNSHAIEAALHRISGLSRFYVYFNNDMFWGRSVSWFDYFRPLSIARQQHRLQRYAAKGRVPCWSAAPQSVVTAQYLDALVYPQTISNGHQSKSNDSDLVKGFRVAFMLEPILYFENVEDPNECRAWPKETFWKKKNNVSVTTTPSTLVSAVRGRPDQNISTDEATNNSSSTRSNTQFWARSTPAHIEEAESSDLEQPEYSDAAHGAPILLKRCLNKNSSAEANASLTLLRLFRPGALFDFQCKLPVVPARGVANRAANNWRHFVNHNKALAFNRIDGALWPTHSFAHYPRLMDRVLVSRMEDGDFADFSQATRRSRERTIHSLWTTHLHQWHALAHRRAVDFDLVKRATGWSYPATNVSTREGPLSANSNAVTPPLSDVCVATRNASSAFSDFGLFHPFSVDAIRPNNDEFSNQRFSIPMLRFLDNDTEVAEIVRPVRDGLPTADDDWGQHTQVEPSSRTSMLEEKLNYHVVRLDRKRGGYYFCMMKTLQIQSRCATETAGMRNQLGGIQLFITVNDDFPRVTRLESAYSRAHLGARSLFEALSGNVSKVPWER